jgi:hypothetical protein
MAFPANHMTFLAHKPFGRRALATRRQNAAILASLTSTCRRWPSPQHGFMRSAGVPGYYQRVLPFNTLVAF